MVSQRLKRTTTLLSALIFSFFLIWLYGVAFQLKLDYFDSYSVLLNARAIAWFRPEEYFWNRFPLLPIALSPFFKLEQVFFREPFAWVACHSLAVTFYALWVWAVYRLTRLYSSHAHGILCAGLLAANRLVLHFAPFCRDDIPAALLATAGFYFYLRSSQKKGLREPLLAGLCWGLAMMARFTLILPAAVTLALFEAGALLKSWKSGLRGKAFAAAITRRVALSALLPLGLFFIVLSLLYSYLDLAPFFQTPQKIMSEIVLMRELVRSKMESTGETFFFLGQSMTWPVFLAAFAGMGLAWKQKRSEAWPLSFWALGFWFYHSVIIFNKEARYLFPLLPPFYYFAALFFLQILKKTAGFLSGWRRVGVCVFAMSGFLFLPMQQALSECLRFLNPIYTAGYAQQVSEGAEQLAGERGKIYWAGKLYALHDRDPLFHPDDEYTYLYHVFGHTLMFHTGRWVDGFPQARFVRTVDPETGKVGAMAVGLGVKLEDGDVLVMNLEPGSYNVRNLPANLSPLLAARVRLLTFNRDSGNAAESHDYRSSDDSQTRLSVHAEAGAGHILSGEGFAPGFYEVYFQSPEGKRVWQGIAHSGQLGLRFRLSAEALKNPTQILLLMYDKILQYSHPD
jgi:hypothetical protein